MARVLLVEDDQHIAGIIQYYLAQNSAYKTDHVADAPTALAAVRERKYDIILLDIMLPEVDGIELCSQMRKSLFCPIIFISCIGDDKTIIEALHMGGDDYLIKPFTCEILHAHMEANLRRMLREKHFPPATLEVHGLLLDSATHSIVKEGIRLELSPIEYNILHLLMEHPDTHFTLEHIYELIWDRPSLGDSRTVMVHIHNLRKKIEDDMGRPTFICSARGKGYYFSAGNDTRSQ
ncbi:response regulator transcription factor [Desulfitobacterium sp. THU1]|uniref:response regulator transcription factor n=1 Tax=Desulfitobacterium sp. THU1 TaxID=3138072 RepID=UPI00311EF253